MTTDTTPASWVMDLVREILHGWFNRLGFFILALSYELFFNIASAEILQSATIRNLYSRVQIILGIFMVFRLTMVALQGIVNPDTITDKKEGFSAIIKRIVIGLLLFAVLTPLNIPNAHNDFEIEVNNNGLLFGTLYSLQNRVLKQNTLGRIILGTTDSSRENTETELQNASPIFVGTVAKAFVSFNLKEGKKDETKAKNRMCNITEQKIIDDYTNLEKGTKLYDPDYITLACNDADKSGVAFASNMVRSLKGENRYVFNYILFAPFIVSIIFAIVLIGYSIDIGIRAFKLIILRLIAPIPIIAYMGPESKENAAFSNWCKALVSTYLDIFIRLAIVYFILFIVIDMIKNGIVMPRGGLITYIFIFLALFLFARQAPQFICNALGIKSLGSNIGLASILGGAAMLGGGFSNGAAAAKRAGAGLGGQILGGLKGAASGFAQGAAAGMEASNEAAASGKSLPLHDIYSKQRDLMEQIKTGDKDARGGIFGKLQNRLNYGNRELSASRLGIGKNALAAADYESKIAEADARIANDKKEQAQSALNVASRKVDAMRGTNGKKMDMNEFAHKMGLNMSDSKTKSLYAKYSTDYDVAVQEEARARVVYEDADKAAGVAEFKSAKAKKTYERMDKARTTMGVAPTVEGIYTTNYRSQTEVITEDYVGSNSDYDGVEVAVDERGRQIQKGGKPETGTNAREKYQYQRTDKEFGGTIDDSTFASRGGGAGGRPGPGGGTP